MLPRSMVDMNTLVAREFRRVRGRDAPLELPLWWAAQLRTVIALQDESDPMRAAAKWAKLPRRMQQDRLFAHLGRLPSANPNEPGGLAWLKIPLQLTH